VEIVDVAKVDVPVTTERPVVVALVNVAFVAVKVVRVALPTRAP
jgi:hypothetical protein